MGAVGMLGKLSWSAHNQIRGVDGSEPGDMSARIRWKDGSLVCLTTAVEGHKLLSVHGMTQQLLYIMVN